MALLAENTTEQHAPPSYPNSPAQAPEGETKSVITHGAKAPVELKPTGN